MVKLIERCCNWRKASSVIAACCSLLLFEGYIFSSISSERKYKIYRFQFACVLNVVFYSGSKFLWKRVVGDVVQKKWPLFLQMLWKCTVIVFIVLSHFAPFTNYFVSTEPYFVNVLSWTCFAAYMELFFILWTFTFLMKLCKGCNGNCLISSQKQSVLAILCTLLITLVAFETANNPPTVVNVEVPIPKLPHSMDGIKIALICDIHLGPTVGYSQLKRVVDVTNSLQPDLIVLAGDLVDISVKDSHDSALSLNDLNAPLGKFYVTGNHEYYTGDVENWLREMEKYGFVVLHNRNQKIFSITNANDWFCLIGTDDIQANQINYFDHGMDLEKAYSGCAKDHAAILVAHQPKAAKIALDSEYNIALVLSGHTHGGQLYPLRWFAYALSPFLNGLYKYKKGYVYVSQGSVYYAFPLRLGTQPEITNISLKALNEEQ